MASALAEATQLRHVNIGDLVKQKNLHDGWDEEFDCHVINEDLVCLIAYLNGEQIFIGYTVSKIFFV